MHCVGITIIRPLLFVSEEEIRCFAKQHGFARIVCQCPVGQDSKRKKAAELLELLEKEFPNARANLMQAALTYGSQKAAVQ
jgi:tRNA(Ile)-lysidine synthase TilS/MesJ